MRWRRWRLSRDGHTAGCVHNTSDREFLAWQLQAFGYALASDTQRDNTCTVKSPSQSALETLINRGRAAGKALLVAGCVPQGDRDAPSLAGCRCWERTHSSGSWR